MQPRDGSLPHTHPRLGVALRLLLRHRYAAQLGQQPQRGPPRPLRLPAVQRAGLRAAHEHQLSAARQWLGAAHHHRAATAA